MKRLITLATLMPVSALAHGGHPPVPETVHGLSHAGPILGFAIVVITGAVVLYQRWRS